MALWCGAAGLAAGSSAVAAEAPTRLTLDAALDRVIATDQTVAIADQEVRRGRIEEMRALSRLFPSLSFGADANWRGNRTKDTVEVEQTPPATTTAPAGVSGTGTTAGTTTAVPQQTATLKRVIRQTRITKTEGNQQGLGFNFSQPILDFTVGPARRQSALDRHISEWQLRQRLREVLFGVTQQYFEVVKQERLVSEGKKTLGLTTEQVRQAEGRFAAQEVIESDVLQARVDDERARRAVMESENALALARSRLAITLNYGPVGEFAVVAPASGRLAAESVRGAVTLAQSQREEIRVAQLSLSRTHAVRDEIKAGYAPTLDFQVSQDLATGSEYDRSTSWTAGFSFNWTLYDRGQRELDLKSNQIDIAQQNLRISDTLRTVADDVVTAWFAVDRLRKIVSSLEIEKKAAEANFQVQQEKYRAGLATSLEVQTAIRDLARVRIDAVNSTFDLEVAYRDLENMLSLYQNGRVEAAMRRLLSVATPIYPNVTPSPVKHSQP